MDTVPYPSDKARLLREPMFKGLPILDDTRLDGYRLPQESNQNSPCSNIPQCDPNFVGLRKGALVSSHEKSGRVVCLQIHSRGKRTKNGTAPLPWYNKS